MCSILRYISFFFNDTATTEIYTLSLHDALPISLTYDANGNLTGDGARTYAWNARSQLASINGGGTTASFQYDAFGRRTRKRSEEHTSELQSRQHLVCRLLLEKKKRMRSTKRYPV